MGKNGNQHSSRNSGIFAIKMAYLKALLSFLFPLRNIEVSCQSTLRVVGIVS